MGRATDSRPGARHDEPSGRLRDAAPVVVCEALRHVYRDDAGQEVVALDDVDLTVRPGEAVGLVGPSGAGKSTLLTLLAGLVRPTSGRVEVCGQEVSSLSERALLRLRSGQVGMVLQTPGRNVLPYATARQNVGFALRSRRWTRAERWERIEDLLGSVGLGANADDRAQVLSGGQQQRLALAIALAGDPALLLADEPTSQLDQRTGEIVTALMLEAREARGTALVVVTHDHGVSDLLDVSYRVHDGVVEPHR